MQASILLPFAQALSCFYFLEISYMHAIVGLLQLCLTEYKYYSAFISRRTDRYQVISSDHFLDLLSQKIEDLQGCIHRQTRPEYMMLGLEIALRDHFSDGGMTRTESRRTPQFSSDRSTRIFSWTRCNTSCISVSSPKYASIIRHAESRPPETV